MVGGEGSTGVVCPERYGQLRARAFGGRLAEQAEFAGFGGAGVPELAVQSRWFAGGFGRRFVSTGGEEVEIVQFGVWNRAAGPDFTGAVVRIGGENRRGAIELDLDARGWENHRHSTNPAYDNVVLHLFLQAPAEQFFTRTSDHRLVPQVRLPAPEPGDPPHPPEAKPGRCAPPLAALPAARVASLLASAARFRLEQKARQLRRAEEAHGWKQALFQGVAEALGYRQNRLPMRVLAQRLPVAELRREGEAGEALLFGLAGFLDANPLDAAADDTRVYLRGLWETWWKRRPDFGMPGKAQELRWEFGGARPANHPHRRVGALAAAAAAWPAFCRVAGTGAPGRFGDVLGFFAALGHPYWSRHYTLAAAPASRPQALVGRSRALEVVANWVAPYQFAHEPAVWDAYTALPAPDVSGPVRRARLRLLGGREDAGRFGRRVHEQQGLLQIYRDYCLADASDCAHCPFPEQLGQW